MSSKKCMQQAVYSLNDKNSQNYNNLDTTSLPLLKGQIFHHAMDDFYNFMKDVNNFNEMNSDQVYEEFRKLMPKTTHPELSKWFNWYSMMDAIRLVEMRREGKLKYFMPFKLELYMEFNDNGIMRTGHCDRIDLIGDKKLRIVEYKTGKSYDPSKSYGLTNVRSELEWYKEIIEHLDEFKGYTVVDWMMINPTVEAVKIGKFSNLTKYSVKKNLDALVEVLDGKVEPIKNKGFICDWCPFFKECFEEDGSNHEIFGQLSKEVDNNE